MRLVAPVCLASNSAPQIRSCSRASQLQHPALRKRCLLHFSCNMTVDQQYSFQVMPPWNRLRDRVTRAYVGAPVRSFDEEVKRNLTLRIASLVDRTPGVIMRCKYMGNREPSLLGLCKYVSRCAAPIFHPDLLVPEKKHSRSCINEDERLNKVLSNSCLFNALPRLSMPVVDIFTGICPKCLNTRASKGERSHPKFLE